MDRVIFDIPGLLVTLRKNGNESSVLGQALLRAADEIDRMRTEIRIQEQTIDLLRLQVENYRGR
jgi:hypothetical protein